MLINSKIFKLLKMDSLLCLSLVIFLFVPYLNFASCFLDEQSLDLNDTSMGISEFVSNDTFSYISSYSPFVLDGFNDMNSFSQMRSVYYDINDFEEVDDKEFVRMANEKGEYKFVTLENKMKVFLASKNILYKSSIAITIRYGAFNEPSRMKGLSILLKNLIISKIKFKTNKRTNPLYFKNLENTVEGRVYGHGTEINIEVFNEDFVDVLHTLSEVLASPLDVDFHTLSSLRKVTREEIKARCISMDNLRSVLVESDFCKKSAYKYLYAFTDAKLNSKDEFKRGYRIGANSKVTDEFSDEYSSLDSILNEHFNKYYCGNLMTLAIVSNENMHYLLTLVKTFFGKIRSSNFSTDELKKTYNFNENPYLKHVGNIVAIKQSSTNLELKLIFPIPYQKNLWRYKLTEYISFFLDDESEEGLVGVLRSRGWITSLSSGCETNESGYSNFVVLINLQKEGVRHIMKILEALLSTIKLISKQDFSEETLFHIREESSIELKNLYLDLDIDQASFILRSYLRTGCFPKDVLVAPFIMDQVEGRHIRKLLNFIRADNMVILCPVKSLSNGASYYLRSSESFLNSFLFKFEKFVFKTFYNISSFFLKWFGAISERTTSRFFKKLHYSEEKLPPYLQRRLSSIDESLASEKLRIQLFDPSLESYSQMYISEKYTTINSPITLRKAMKEKLLTADNLFGNSGTRKVNSNSSQYIGDDFSEKNDILLNLDGVKFYSNNFELNDDGDLINFKQGNFSHELYGNEFSNEYGKEYEEYIEEYKRSGLDYEANQKINSLYPQFNMDSIFYMPLQNKLPTLSIVFDITIPFDLNNSTDLLLLNMNKQKLLLLSFLFKNSMNLSLANAHSDGVIKAENYTDFMNINVLPGIQLSWDGITKYFDDFFVAFMYNLVNYRTIITNSYFEQSITALKKLLERLSHASNEDYSLMQLLQIMHLESVKPWALENDAKHLTLEDVRLFGKILLKYGEVHGVVIGNCTPSQIYSRIDKFIKLIRPSARLFNSIEQINSGKFSMTFGTQSDEWISDKDLTDEMIKRSYMGPMLMNAESKGNLITSKFINMNLLPPIYHKNYFFKRRASSSDPFNTVLLYIYLGFVDDGNKILLDLLELVDFRKVLNSFIANKKSLRYSSIQIGSLPITHEVAGFQIRVTFLSNKIIPMTNIILEFFDTYFLNPEKVFSNRDFLSLKSMLLSNFQRYSLNPSKLAQIHYERVIRANLAPNWQVEETIILQSLCYLSFIKLWDSFRTAPTILLVIESNRNQDDQSTQLSEFVPEGYTRLKSIYQFKDSFN
ncbi:secreted insulinase like peptidase [Cryptosporidium sp. chipmunk genotype I]|uniref:secreted insulinase like peptidase n=1 Tax=Cryptosporidium sp. chipmunk genotype I TaxID=1280935 RepID=UPI003519E44F|nr:secreted insulinase like peptidase [Cryptosporidium sp. chipmunk genotype I]